jgi:isoquinoline 1-oxidoreductase alpha subunit
VIALRVNGVARSFNGDGNMPLLWYLRDELAMTGSKFGCAAALCAAPAPYTSMAKRCAAAEGKDVTTIEGLDPDGDHPVQRAWRAHNVPQCGLAP